VKVIVLLGHGRPLLPAPRGVELLDSTGQAAAAVLGDLLQRRQLAELHFPVGAVALLR
jgi:hypothetical protein